MYDVQSTLENKSIELVIQGGASKKTNALNLCSILKDVSSDFIDVLEKPQPNGNNM